MNSVIKRLSKQFGYNVSDSEIINLYKCGNLLLSDKEENDIIKYINDQI
jgi:hypothetical protein